MGTLEDVEVIAENLDFPEGPVALSDGSVLVVEVRRGTLSRVREGGRVDVVAECHDGPNGAAIGPDGACYVANNGGIWPNRSGVGRIQRVDLATGEVDDLYESCDGRELLAPNDLVFDATGGMWFTDTGSGSERTTERGCVYYAAADGSHIHEVVGPTDSANGIGLSPDGNILYYAETLMARVHRREITAPGQLAPIEPVSSGTVFFGRKPSVESILVRLPGCAELTH